MGPGPGSADMLTELEINDASAATVEALAPSSSAGMRASHAAWAWGHIAPDCPSLTVLSRPVGGTGAENRRLPTGGAAYRMLEKL